MKPKKFYMHKISNLVNVQQIVTVHYQKLDDNYVSQEEEHNFWELLYLDKGALSIVENGETHRLEQGECILVAPNIPHYVCDGNEDPFLFIISFASKSEELFFLAGKNLRVEQENRYLLQDVLSEASETFALPEFNPALNKLEPGANPPLGGEQVIKNSLELFFIRLMRNENDKANEQRFFLSKINSSGELQDEIVKYLNGKLYDSFSLDELCDELHYGKTHLCTFFRKKTGMSIYQTYLKLKTEEAKKLIRKGVPFPDIATKLCFDSLSHFNNVFRRHANMTPMQYKKSIHENFKKA